MYSAVVVWKFCKEDESLEDEEHSGRPSEVDSDRLRGLVKLIFLQQEVAEEIKVDHSVIIWHLKQIGKVKNLDKWVPHEMTKNQKKSLLWSVVFSYSVQQQWTISWLDCDVWWKVDFRWQPASTSSVVGQRSSKALPKAKLAPKKVMVTVWWSAAHLTHYSFLNPGKPLCLRSMLSKSVRCTKNCSAHSWHWSTERAQFFSTTMPNLTSHNQHFRSWMNWAMKFCLICHIPLTAHQLTTTSSSISTTFHRETAPLTRRRQKILSKSSSNSEAWIFMLQE